MMQLHEAFDTHHTQETYALMTRYHYSKKPGGSRGSYLRPRAPYGEATGQATMPFGGRMNHSTDALQSKIDKWQAGTDELEAEMAKVRATLHSFVPMGKLPACERCGSGRNDRLDDKPIHYGGE